MAFNLLISQQSLINLYYYSLFNQSLVGFFFGFGVLCFVLLIRLTHYEHIIKLFTCYLFLCIDADMNFKNLNRKQKRRLAKFMTNENVKQSSNNFNLAFLRFNQRFKQ